jgi:hypothetical protein
MWYQATDHKMYYTEQYLQCTKDHVYVCVCVCVCIYACVLESSTDVRLMWYLFAVTKREDSIHCPKPNEQST